MYGIKGPLRRALAASVAVLALGGALGACSPFEDEKDGTGSTGAGSAAASAGSGSDAKGGPQEPSGKVEAGWVKGRVVDTQGRPIKGAEVVVDNQLLYDSNLVLTTDANGEYRAELPPIAATYAVTASFKKTYENNKYTFALQASDPEAFVGKTGAVRDFTWQLTGERADMPDSFHGATVVYYLDPMNPVDDSYADSANVRLTLTPVGPLVDGSTGKTVERKPENTGDGWAVRDIPVGKYKITAKFADGAGGRTQPLEVRIRNGGGSFASEVTTVFKPELTDRQMVSIELQF
jgi:hypothetical protein